MAWLAGLSWIAVVGYCGLVVLVIGWLVVSFTPPSPRREIVEWISACGMYVALLMLFVNLATRAHEAGSVFGLVAFGLLVTLFGVGLCVCLVHTLRTWSGNEASESSATN